jgi:signal transduction histidine kinase
MQPAIPTRGDRSILAGAAIVAVGLIAAYALIPADPRGRSVVSNAAQMVVGLLSGVAMLRASRRPGAWRGTWAFGMAGLLIALVNGVFLAQDLSGGALTQQPGIGDVLFLALGVLILLPFREELREHFDEEDRREVAADVALVATAAGALVYLLVRPDPGAGISPAALLSSVIFATSTVVGFTAWGALTLWVPSPIHGGIFAVMALMSGAGIQFGYHWVRGTYASGSPLVELPFGLAPLLLAGLLTVEPAFVSRPARRARGTRGRPILTAAAVVAACAALVVSVAVYRIEHVTTLEESAILAVIALALIGRIVLNQLRSTRDREEARRALADKEAALREKEAALGAKESALIETDATLAALRRAHEAVAGSEERLRSLFDAAVDGVVELDGLGVVRRANEAFATMVALPIDRIVGRPWAGLAAMVEGADLSLASLPETGQATVHREDQSLHLESRTSALPDPDGGRLLLIRDVTAAKVADQTIRNLFKFLQDRDDDRTRLLRRTNTAIEQERNRIARDLHDGPVQGVSAASLSLEAVLLMLKHGDIGQGIDVLTKVRRELAEECDDLRRLMSDLRPPVLEERGLIPALREVVERFEAEMGMATSFRGRSLVDLPSDLETLAYRVVQEALSNAGKHSRARRVDVVVEAIAGQVRIEIADDGRGFEPNRARDFLRMGRVGLASMRERTELANGTFMVRSTPDGGTTVVATLPLGSTVARDEAVLA